MGSTDCHLGTMHKGTKEACRVRHDFSRDNCIIYKYYSYLHTRNSSLYFDRIIAFIKLGNVSRVRYRYSCENQNVGYLEGIHYGFEKKQNAEKVQQVLAKS